MNAELETAIDQMDAFPILPDAAIELIELANTSAFLFKDMVSIIERDPSIAANVMKEANSPGHGRPGQVSSINQASEILNIKELAEMVMKSATASYFSSGGEEGYVYLIRMRDHGVLTARIAKVLAAEMGIMDAKMMYLAGLIHDAGFIILAKRFWADFSKIISETSQEEKGQWEKENDVFGISHAEVGGAVFDKWNLPPAICQAIRFHHRPWDAPSFQQEATIIHFADFLGHYMLDRSAPFDLKKKIDRFLHSPGADLVEKYGFSLTAENFVKITEKLDEKTPK